MTASAERIWSSWCDLLRALADGDDATRRDAAHHVRAAGRPTHFDSIDDRRVAEAERRPQIVDRVIARLAEHGARLRASAARHENSGTDPLSIRSRAFEPNRQPVVAAL